MKIKLDENMPSQLAVSLETLGHDVETVHREGLGGASDPKKWEAAQRESRFLITQDLDFSDARQFTPGSHAGILVVRLHSPSRANLTGRIQTVFRTEAVNEWLGWFVVVTERKIRVRLAPRHGPTSRCD